MRTADFMPGNPGVPTGRPNIELSGDPDAATILNSDGRLTSVPVPGQKPNFFELETQKEKVDDVTKAYRQAAEAKADFWLDISFQERQAERSAIDRQVATTLTRYGFNEDLNSPEANAIRQGLRRDEAKDAFKGFFDGIHQEAWANGGKIGDAIVKSALNAAQKASEKAWDAIFDQLATAAANWLTGGSGKSSGAGGVVSNLLGGAANGNASFAAPVGAVARSSLGPVSGSGAELAWNFWKSKGLADHQVAGVLGNIKAESAFNPLAVGDGGNAFGLYQHNDRRNNLFKAIGGKGNLSNALAQHEFAYSELMGPESRAWQALTSAKDVRGATAAFAGFERPSGFSWGNPEGAHNFAGRLDGAEAALAKFGGTAQQATQGLGQFGNGLSQVGSSLATGGAGGGSGWLSFLSGTIFSGSGQLARSGGIGLFADGTSYAPGGLSVVGERGPELLKLPRGSQVFDTNRSARMMGGNGNSSSAPANLNVNVIGANGDEHVRALVRQGVGQALSQYNEQQRRVGFGETQKRFVAQKG
ncbi:phage tail tip lysozyme [Sinorhizobium meliloti]|uniref:phage tail tip lysozyme n=1 Tax=Rhizobium meliloti TaxID=382 RepID=UPI003F5CCDFD